VRLKADGETLSRTRGSHTPVLNYQIEEGRSVRLTLEADIHTRLKKTTRIDRGNDTDIYVDFLTERRTVSDSIDVQIYDLSATPSYAEYPNGDTGVAIFQSQPWRYRLTADTDAKVRGVWRFYTARDSNWDRLIRSDEPATMKSTLRQFRSTSMRTRLGSVLGRLLLMSTSRSSLVTHFHGQTQHSRYSGGHVRALTSSVFIGQMIVSVLAGTKTMITRILEQRTSNSKRLTNQSMIQERLRSKHR